MGVVIYSMSSGPAVCAGEAVIIAKRVHPFPSRTRSLSSSALMILWGQLHGKIRHRRLTRPHGRFLVLVVCCAGVEFVWNAIFAGQPGMVRAQNTCTWQWMTQPLPRMV